MNSFALLGVAYASNIGGMLSPVASPQNLIALMAIQTTATGNPGSDGGTASVSFGAWVGIALPFCGVLLLLCWAFLLVMYRKDLPSSLPPITIDHARPGQRGSGADYTLKPMNFILKMMNFILKMMAHQCSLQSSSLASPSPRSFFG